MRKLIESIKYWGQLLLLPIYWLSFFIPRNKNIWLFGSTFGKRYADNPRYLYQYCIKRKDLINIRPIWISSNKTIIRYLTKQGYEAYYYHSFLGIYYALKGKVYLYDNYSKDINFWQSAGAVKINMWHGIPLKKIQADNIFDTYRHPSSFWAKLKNLPRNISDEKPSDYILTTSSKLKPIFSSAFRTKNVITCGYPRNDYLISNEIENLILPIEQKEMAMVEKFCSLFGQCNCKVVFYMPTFRDSEIKFFDVMDLDKFQEFLAQQHMLFCIKLHPKSKLQKQFDRLAYKNILVLNVASDPYILLKKTDVLVTDYSSIYFDFLLLNRPIIFFSYDLDDYLTLSREMYWNYIDITPGEKTTTMDGLMTALLNAIHADGNYQRKYSKWRENLKKKVFDMPTNLAAPKLIDEIMKIMK